MLLCLSIAEHWSSPVFLQKRFFNNFFSHCKIYCMKVNQRQRIHAKLYDKAFSVNVLRQGNFHTGMIAVSFEYCHVMSNRSLSCSMDHGFDCGHVVQYIWRHIVIFAVPLIFQNSLLRTVIVIYDIARIMSALISTTSRDQ